MRFSSDRAIPKMRASFSESCGALIIDGTVTFNATSLLEPGAALSSGRRAL